MGFKPRFCTGTRAPATALEEAARGAASRSSTVMTFAGAEITCADVVTGWDIINYRLTAQTGCLVVVVGKGRNATRDIADGLERPGESADADGRG